MTVQEKVEDLLQVDIDLAAGGGLLIGGRAIPYTQADLKFTANDVPALTVETIAIGGEVHGPAQVTYRVEYIDSLATAKWPVGEGSSVPAALRDLADKIEAGA